MVLLWRISYRNFFIEPPLTDREDPTIVCPGNITQDNDDGESYATITLPDPADVSVSDNSATALTTTAEPSGTMQFNIGNHDVTYTVTDESGNSASCILTVTVTGQS